jgi:hypothetical protein
MSIRDEELHFSIPSSKDPNTRERSKDEAAPPNK